MKNIINIYKPVGKTPLEVIQQFQVEYPYYKNKKIAYAGRLDPMAEGVLILLVYPKTKERNTYQKLSKKYEFEILFGFSSDTYDILGIPQQTPPKSKIQKIHIDTIVKELVGKKMQSYPPYSSKTVKGKPLFWWARENRLDEIDIPKKEVNIYSIVSMKMCEIKSYNLLEKIEQKIYQVEGDFRQKTITLAWKNFLEENDATYTIARCSIECSSGTYVRSISHEMGEKLNSGALAFSIKRTSVGEFTLKNSIRLSGFEI